MLYTGKLVRAAAYYLPATPDRTGAKLGAWYAAQLAAEAPGDIGEDRPDTFNADAARLSWSRSVAFLREQLA